ncbi:FliM/FliN family flagellar motor switch protein [Collimonas humicola]|uniref:FliM/FliN family flagellar motor switch protein n=1 Tax=Collimonas humicola TaxID=2825886 RepID=UPI001B8B45E5|nr:FliM/FliN family flagellar motor switch protein [Collimonas humicola]
MQAVNNTTQAGVAAGQAFRTMHWWPEADLARLAQALDAARARWRSAWLDQLSPHANEDAMTDIVCALAHQADFQPGAGNWQPVLAENEDADSQVWLDASQVSGEALAAVLLNMTAPQSLSAKGSPGLVSELVQAAWQDCIKALRSSLGSASVLYPESGRQPRFGASGGIGQALPVRHMSAWSGAVRVSLPWCGLQLALHIGPGRVANLLGADKKETLPAAPAASDALVPLHKALSRQQTSLRLELSAVELDLGSLQALVVGDVIPLPHKLEQPLAVIGEDGKLLCGAYLGQQQGMRAIELVRVHAGEFPAAAPAL